ncbi:protein of unknown function [Legionella hackeliae]|uniref:Uncharacterized protein n=1 Tax=Legionella hackeliae TaxID=449 RepID=A0A0A8UWI6_LEGHA|nr:protein of unknown function [Legionella hackeliae]
MRFLLWQTLSILKCLPLSKSDGEILSPYYSNLQLAFDLIPTQLAISWVIRFFFA